jgi:hypothetical protein
MRAALSTLLLSQSKRIAPTRFPTAALTALKIARLVRQLLGRSFVRKRGEKSRRPDRCGAHPFALVGRGQGGRGERHPPSRSMSAVRSGYALSAIHANFRSIWTICQK